LLSFLGITEIEFVYAEGLALGDAARIAAFESAARRSSNSQTRHAWWA